MKKIFAIVKHPGEKIGHIMEIDNTVEGFQEVVGGHFETVTLAEDLVIICDEDGRFKDCPNNCKVLGVDFVGTIMAVGAKGDEFTDCPLGLNTWEAICQ